MNGNTVDVHLEALESDGSTNVYDGSYQVSNGEIVEGQLTQTDTVAPAAPAAPASPSAPPQGITDPNGGFYARGAYCPDADAGLTTVDADGNVLTCVFESGRYHWH